MIDISKASKRIKGSLVLDSVSITIPNGAIVGLAGVNGSGKTMLLRAIAGLIGLTSGSISVDGQIIGRDRTFPPSIGLLIENPAFLNAYTGRDNLRMLAGVGRHVSGVGAKAHALADKLAVRSLEAVGLDPFDKRKFRKYSLGMKQRLGIAAAIMEEPDIVLLDEPTNALDVQGVSLFEELVDAQRRRGATLLIASHDASLLDAMADIVYTFSDGKVIDVSVQKEPPVLKELS